MSEMVKVMATQRGHFGDRTREEGETFMVPRELLTAKKDEKGKVVPPTWFEEVVEEEVRTTRAVRRSEVEAQVKDASDLA